MYAWQPPVLGSSHAQIVIAVVAVKKEASVNGNQKCSDIGNSEYSIFGMIYNDWRAPYLPQR